MGLLIISASCRQPTSTPGPRMLPAATPDNNPHGDVIHSSRKKLKCFEKPADGWSFQKTIDSTLPCIAPKLPLCLAGMPHSTYGVVTSTIAYMLSFTELLPFVDQHLVSLERVARRPALSALNARSEQKKNRTRIRSLVAQHEKVPSLKCCCFCGMKRADFKYCLSLPE